MKKDDFDKISKNLNELSNSSKKSKKPSKKVIYALILIIVILASICVLYSEFQYNENTQAITNDSFKENQKTPKLIGNNSLGNVYIEGPYGNKSSSIKIAYLVGQHPRESNAHDAVYVNLVNDSKELKYCYYVYNISVKAEDVDFEDSRMNGQLLAEEFVVPHITKKNFDFFIDVHASNGGYIQDSYVFAPVKSDKVALKKAKKLTKILPWLVYYTPSSYSSPQYSTIPIDENGIPSIIFEIYGTPDYSLSKQAHDFIHAVDKLKFK